MNSVMTKHPKEEYSQRHPHLKKHARMAYCTECIRDGFSAMCKKVYGLLLTHTAGNGTSEFLSFRLLLDWEFCLHRSAVCTSGPPL